MVQEYLDPDANINTLWARYDYTLIDDGVRDPTTPTGYPNDITTNEDDDDEEQIWSFENTTKEYGSITQIVVKLYIAKSEDTYECDDPDIRIKVGGSWETPQTLAINDTPQWRDVTFSGSWSASDVDDLQVGVDCGSQPKHTSGMQIDAIYCDISGGEASGSSGGAEELMLSANF